MPLIESPPLLTPTEIQTLGQSLAQGWVVDAAQRDQQGGTPLRERQQLRQSGLLKLTIPTEYGGLGHNWITTFDLVRAWAAVDSSLAHVFSYHYLGLTIPHLFGSTEQKERHYTEAATQGWFWCNALNPLDRRAVLIPEGSHFRLQGRKSFCSGAKDSDRMPVGAVHAVTGELLVIILPTTRSGITILDDWDNMGQRQTDSGTVTFEQVYVDPEEILSNRLSSVPFRSMRACLTQANLATIYVGIAQGALTAAQAYTRGYARPWLTSSVSEVTRDPYVLQHYGEMWVELQGALALVERAVQAVQAAWDQEWSLTAEQRGACAIAVATAKVAATRVGLGITSRIFEAMGARSTTRSWGFDRYWRNLRTLTLHDPVEYKVQAVGDWVLNDHLPTPDFYT